MESDEDFWDEGEDGGSTIAVNEVDAEIRDNNNNNNNNAEIRDEYLFSRINPLSIKRG